MPVIIANFSPCYIVISYHGIIMRLCEMLEKKKFIAKLDKLFWRIASRFSDHS